MSQNYDCYTGELNSTSWMQASQKFFHGGRAGHLHGKTSLMKGKWDSKFWDDSISLKKCAAG